MIILIVIVVIYLLSVYVVHRHISNGANEGEWTLGAEDLAFTLVPVVNTFCALVTIMENMGDRKFLKWFFRVK